MMNSIGVFELMSGKTIISRYQECTLDGAADDVFDSIYKLEKPLLLQSVDTAQGVGTRLIPMVGMYPECTLYPYGVAAVNLDAVDKGMADAYVKATTGIQIASPGASMPMPPRRQ